MHSRCLSYRHVKVYNTTNYKVVHNFDYAAAVLSLALAVRNPPFVTCCVYFNLPVDQVQEVVH